MTLIDYSVYHVDVVVLLYLLMVLPHTHMDHYRCHPVVFDDDDDPPDMMMDVVMSNQLMIPGRLMAVVDLLLVPHMVDNDVKNVVVVVLLLHNDDGVMMVVVHDYTLHYQHCHLVVDHHTLKNDDVEEDDMDNDLGYFQKMVVDQHLVLYIDCIGRDHLCFEMTMNREYREAFHWR